MGSLFLLKNKMPMPDIIGPLAGEYIRIAEEREKRDSNYSIYDDLEGLEKDIDEVD